MVPIEHQMLTTKLENLMFAMFSLMSSCFGKGMLSVCCCTLEARNFFFFVQHVLTIKRWSSVSEENFQFRSVLGWLQTMVIPVVGMYGFWHDHKSMETRGRVVAWMQSVFSRFMCLNSRSTAAGALQEGVETLGGGFSLEEIFHWRWTWSIIEKVHFLLTRRLLDSRYNVSSYILLPTCLSHNHRLDLNEL